MINNHISYRNPLTHVPKPSPDYLFNYMSLQSPFDILNSKPNPQSTWSKRNNFEGENSLQQRHGSNSKNRAYGRKNHGRLSIDEENSTEGMMAPVHRKVRWVPQRGHQILRKSLRQDKGRNWRHKVLGDRVLHSRSHKTSENR